jgi:hypothetical protein
VRASVLEVEAAVADAQRWLIQVNTEWLMQVNTGD